MKITYTLQADDLLAFYKQGLKKNSFIFKNYVFIVGVFIALIISYYSRSSGIENNSQVTQFSIFMNNFWFASAVNLVFVTICIFLVRVIIITFFKFQLKNKKRFLGNRDLEILNDKLVFSALNSKTEYLFTAIQNIEANRNHYFIYTSNISAIIVPTKTEGSNDFIKQVSAKTKLNVHVY